MTNKQQAAAIAAKENEAVDKACKELINEVKSQARDRQIADDLIAQAHNIQEEGNTGDSNSRFSNLWELMRLVKSFLTLPLSSNQSRRVTVQFSPDLSIPTPPSVTQEQQRRREGSMPKGIMRPPATTTVAEDSYEAERKRLLQKSQVPGSGIFSHGIVSQQTDSAMSDGRGSAGINAKEGLQPGSRKRARSGSELSVPRKMAKTDRASGGDEAIENEHNDSSARVQTYSSKPSNGSSRTSTQHRPSTRSYRRSKNAIIEDSQESVQVAVN